MWLNNTFRGKTLKYFELLFDWTFNFYSNCGFEASNGATITFKLVTESKN